MWYYSVRHMMLEGDRNLLPLSNGVGCEKVVMVVFSR